MKNKTLLLIPIVIVIIAAIIGLIIASIGNILFSVISLAVLIIVFFGLTVLFFGIIVIAEIIGYRMKRKILIYPLSVFLCLTLSLIMTLAISHIKINHKEQKVDILIKQIEKYKTQEGRYPNSIEGFDKEHPFDGLQYNTDSSNQTFTLSYMTDGWHLNSYGSETKEWKGTD